MGTAPPASRLASRLVALRRQIDAWRATCDGPQGRMPEPLWRECSDSRSGRRLSSRFGRWFQGTRRSSLRDGCLLAGFAREREPAPEPPAQVPAPSLPTPTCLPRSPLLIHRCLSPRPKFRAGPKPTPRTSMVSPCGISTRSPDRIQIRPTLRSAVPALSASQSALQATRTSRDGTGRLS